MCRTPFERADAPLAAAACRAGAVGVLDLGRDAGTAHAALRALARDVRDGFGVRVADPDAVAPEELPDSAELVVLAAGVSPGPWLARRVLVEATTLEEARAAEAAGAWGVIAKGAESGGRVGEEGSFVLVQRLVGELGVPVWAQGGIGVHTAAAAVAGGAAGVVLDAQLALLRESTLPADVRAAVAAMDGSETRVVAGHRVYARPDLAVSAGDVPQRLGADGLDAQILPAGQDASFARPLAERYETVAGVVRAVRAAMRENVRKARLLRPLAPGSALAAAHGVRYPIAQGPMTRVSDRVAFAEAVADGGALPFLALALMRGPEVQALLDEASERLAGRTWGVGILGFVPPELREEQLAAVHAVRPPAALIAGGRPAQARPLEEAGIAAYIHVPSPNLLDLFLKHGARRFVFEGRECGGHVGPRTSFALWEAQVERLLRHESPEELSVLFAGGIHDARSAAMVEALAAPLAERGGKIGVLMGTAYLFTREAVESGAVLPGFQDAAVAADRTVLLETAPGHATRCAATPYVDAFLAEKARLEAEDRPQEEVWAELERLNLGRLRIASKGVRRDGGELVAVDAETQKQEGMVMLGQVAALRERTTTISELHADVSERPAAYLDRVSVSEPAPRAPAPPPANVAIVGMACVFPGAADLETYWSNIVAGVDAVTEVPRERWNPELHYDPNGTGGDGKSPSKWGGFLPTIAFDPAAFGIPPRSLAAIEPAQLLALEVSRRALADAGYLDRDFDRERAAVIFGADSGADLLGAYTLRTLLPQYAGELPPELDDALPGLTEDSFPGVLANVIAGRIANRLDLGGANYTVDAACASSLAALDLAVKELVTGTSDVVLCGGADLHCAIGDYLMFASVRALSPTGRCRTFDAAADGIALGEGVAVLVLKRLADAERDGDRVYAVVKGVGASSDGKSLGLTAPRRQGQVRALERAYRTAGVSPAEVGLVEAHGTGTVVGDRTELETLTEVYAGGGAEPGTVALGSVKSQIGHTKCAAGLAGLIKVALALHRGILPPTINVEQPNPGWEPQASPFVIGSGAHPWLAAERKAAVSAFGFGGTNFHAVLAGHAGDEPATGLVEWPAELFLLRGDTRADAVAHAERVLVALAGDEASRWPLRDLARSVSAARGSVQIALVASDLDDLREKLESARGGQARADGVFFPTDGVGAGAKVAFLFPGQGSQRVGMLRDVFLAFPSLRRYLVLGERWRDRIFPPTAWSDAERAAQKDALTDTRVAQPALGIAGLAAADLLQRLGVRPDVAGGHSYGELVALAAAGALDEAELLRLSEARGERILAAAAAADGDAGAMAAVAAERRAVAERIADIDGLVIANENAPDQVVVSGPTPAVEAAVERLAAAGLTARRIPVACAFHSPLVAAAADSFADDLRDADLRAPRIPVYSNTTAQPHASEPDAIRDALADHVRLPVRFSDELEAMYADGVRVFVEAGPGRVLTSLVGRTLAGRPHVAVACDDAGRHGITQLLLALARLAANGVPVDAELLFAGRDASLVDLSQLASRRLPETAWWVSGHRAWPVAGPLPEHALRPVPEPVVSYRPAAVADEGARETVVLEYLRSARELVEAQRRVVLAYLGEAAPEAGVVARAPAAAAEPAPPAPPPAAPAEPEAEVASAEELLLAVVSERTGYPVEMLGLDLDLEAELSIDSIKRIEILGALAERLGTLGDGDEVPEELATVKTLRGILDWLGGAGADGASAAAGAPEPATPAADAAGRGAGEPVALEAPLGRYVLELVDAGEPVRNGTSLAGSTVAVAGAGGAAADALCARLAALGATVRRTADAHALAGIDVLVDVSALDEHGEPSVQAIFSRVQAAVAAGAAHVVVATALGGAFARGRNGSTPLAGGGVAGLLKAIAKEYPDRNVRAVDLDPAAEPDALAGQLVAELLAGDRLAEVGYRDGVRRTLRPVAAPRNGAHGVALGPESVVLVTGGARGITARVAIELARRFGCRLELVGRSPLPGVGAADAELDAAPDVAALRGVLARRGGHGGPAEIEREARRLLAEREVRATLAALAEAGVEVGYHPVDVRDDAALSALLDDLYARHGRIDGIVHGAGVIEDKLLRDKSGDSFARVYDTKALPALTIARKLRDDVSFVAFFSSVSGAFGNRGQSDYAAANDFLDKLAVALNERVEGRIVSINWGPWASAGMVSAELEREYARRGIALIRPDEGAESFVDELLHGAGDDAQVILMRAEPSSFD